MDPPSANKFDMGATLPNWGEKDGVQNWLYGTRRLQEGEMFWGDHEDDSSVEDSDESIHDIVQEERKEGEEALSANMFWGKR